MGWRAKERVHLPFSNVTKNAGDTISQEEMDAARQTDEDVAALVEGGAIEEES